MKTIIWREVNEFPYLESEDEKQFPSLIAEDENRVTWAKFNQMGRCDICGKEIKSFWENIETGEQICDEHVEFVWPG